MPKDEEIRQLLGDPSLSDWFKRALRLAMERDPVDAANDAELLCEVLDRRTHAGAVAVCPIIGSGFSHLGSDRPQVES